MPGRPRRNLERIMINIIASCLVTGCMALTAYLFFAGAESQRHTLME